MGCRTTLLHAWLLAIGVVVPGLAGCDVGGDPVGTGGAGGAEPEPPVLDGGSWSTQTIVEAGDMLRPFNPTIAIGEDGKTHIAYARSDGAEWSIWYANDSGETFDATQVAGNSFGLSEPVLRVAAGTVHLVYAESGGPGTSDLRYWTLADGDFSGPTDVTGPDEPAPGRVVLWPDLAAGQNGEVAVLGYFGDINGTVREVRVVRFDLGAPEGPPELVMSECSVPRGVFDEDGVLHVVANCGDILYANDANGFDNVTELGQADDASQVRPLIALGVNGQTLHVVFERGVEESHDIVRAIRAEGDFDDTVRIVPATDAVTRAHDAAVDPFDRLLVLSSIGGPELLFGHLDDLDATELSPEGVDELASEAQMAVDPLTGETVIVFIEDGPNGALKVARYVPPNG